MSRLQKKCLLASTGLHGLLLLVLIVGPAFVRRKQEMPPPTIQLVHPGVISAILSAPAAPAAPASTPPQPRPPEPKRATPPPEPKRTVPPPEPKRKVETSKPAAKPPPKPPVKIKQAPVKPPTVKTVKTETPSPRSKVKVANLDKLYTPRDPEEERRQREKTQREAERLRQKQMSQLNRILDTSFSSPVKIQVQGGSSVSFMSYGQHVISVYERNWHVPGDLAGLNHSVAVTVTIARDGRVRSARIVGRSGVGAVDRSVQETIEVVRRFEPFPAGSTEDEKTFTVDFNLQAKRASQ